MAKINGRVTALQRAKIARDMRPVHEALAKERPTAARPEVSKDFLGFIGWRAGDETPVLFVDGPMRVPLDLRLDVRNHSPTGFEWGYHGSGPAQLALAICCFMLGQERAERVYEDFKSKLIAPITADAWTIGYRDALDAIMAIEGERRGAGATAEEESATEHIRNALQVLRTAGVPNLGKDVSFDQESVDAIVRRLTTALAQLEAEVVL